MRLARGTSVRGTRDTNLIYQMSVSSSVLRYGDLSGITGVAASPGPVSFQFLLKPTYGKPTKRDDGIPRSNEFSASVSSYSLPKDFS